MTLEQRIIALAQAIGVDIRALASQGLGSESGVWVPSVQAATGYLSRSGRYTRLGKLVFIEGAFVLDSTKNGGPVIAGLPFPAHPNAPSAGIHIHQFKSARNFVALTGEVLPGTSTFQVLAATGGATSLTTFANTFGTQGSLNFSGRYTIA
jgi:hypothetical protein